MTLLYNYSIMNEVIFNNNNQESRYFALYWNTSNEQKKDSRKIDFPKPVHVNQSWTGQEQFLGKFMAVQNYLKLHNFINLPYNEFDDKCMLCNSSIDTSFDYNIDNVVWNSGTYHYIEKHNIIPPEKFKNIIFEFDTDKHINKIIKFKYKTKSKHENSIVYIKFDKNIILILDALMSHGGYTKKYYDSRNEQLKYSEHSGYLAIKNNVIDKIIVSAKVSKTSKYDKDIFFPQNFNAKKCKYIYHTHPPTPLPGSRYNVGIIYDLPSIQDLLHFIDYTSMYDIIGSMVMASEGLYNVRKFYYDANINEINEDGLFKDYNEITRKIHKLSMQKYKKELETRENKINDYLEYFYTNIAQDTGYIKNVNDVLNKYHLHIDYFPRQYDGTNNWFVDSIYLPLFELDNDDD